jgi:hypothetical protein
MRWAILGVRGQAFGTHSSWEFLSLEEFIGIRYLSIRLQMQNCWWVRFQRPSNFLQVLFCAILGYIVFVHEVRFNNKFSRCGGFFGFFFFLIEKERKPSYLASRIVCLDFHSNYGLQLGCRLLLFKDSEGPRFAQIEGSAHQSTRRCNG